MERIETVVKDLWPAADVRIALSCVAAHRRGRPGRRGRRALGWQQPSPASASGTHPGQGECRRRPASGPGCAGLRPAGLGGAFGTPDDFRVLNSPRG